MTIQCSWIQFEVPNHLAGVPDKKFCPLGGGCGCGCGCCQKPPAGPPVPVASRRPVRYGSGEVVQASSDLEAGGFGVPWGHTRTFASGLTESANAGNGYNWQVQQWTYLVVQDDGSVAVMGRANDVLCFDPVEGGYVPNFDVRQTLLLDSSNNVFELVHLDGSITTYSASSGALISHSDPAGNQVTVVGYVSNGFNFSEVQRSYSDGNGNTTVESYLYTYQDATTAHPVLTSVLLQRKVNDGAWSNVSQVLYTYYGANDPNGGLNDLQTVEKQTWTESGWASLGTTFYRYVAVHSVKSRLPGLAGVARINQP